MNKRHTQILDLLTKNKKMEVTKLSEILRVSQVTIRKDLDILVNSGIVIREHGYATLNESDDINNRLAYHYDIKQNIVKKVVNDIQNGETIMIESGSCCQSFFVDKLFIGIDGFMKDTGFTGNDYMRSEAVRDMANQASHVIVVSDSVKFNQKGIVNLIDTNQVSCIYTDKNIPDDIEEYLVEQNIKVIKS